MLRLRRFFLPLILLALAVWLGLYLIGNTSLELRSSSLQEGSLELETKLPRDRCLKVLSREFPFIHFNCEQSSEPASITGSEPLAPNGHDGDLDE
jgi:hypothetical protein